MKGETRERILHTAHDLMAERGYSAFSYADIAEKIAITKASIHFHFPTKAALAVEVLRTHREKLVHGMEHLDSSFPDPLARIAAYVNHWEGCIRDRTMPFCIAALLAAELPSLPKEVAAQVEEHFTVLQQWMEHTLKEGVRKKTLKLRSTATAEAHLLMAVLHGAMLSARATGSCDVFKLSTGIALKHLSA